MYATPGRKGRIAIIRIVLSGYFITDIWKIGAIFRQINIKT